MIKMHRWAMKKKQTNLKDLTKHQRDRQKYILVLIKEIRQDKEDRHKKDRQTGISKINKTVPILCWIKSTDIGKRRDRQTDTCPYSYQKITR